MKAIIKNLAFCVLVGVATHCIQPEPHMIRFMGEAQGTYYIVTYYDEKERDFSKEIETLLKDFDLSASLWEPNSVISKINRNQPGERVDSVILKLFELSKEVYEKSGGAFDPTVGPLVNGWGFGFTNRLYMDQSVIDSLLQLVGFNRLTLTNNQILKDDQRIQIDFNAIAQGYSVDLIGKFLTDQGINNYLIDVGGEVLGKGNKPGGENWRVGIEKPSDHAEYGTELEAIVILKDRALATSGNYRKFYEQEGVRYSHTIDPVTGYPVQHSLLSVSVLAPDCARADAWATAFMVLGTEKSLEVLKKEEGLEAFFIYSEPGETTLKTIATEGFGKILD
jgi:FAD:protein FMN transferase